MNWLDLEHERYVALLAWVQELPHPHDGRADDSAASVDPRVTPGLCTDAALPAAHSDPPLRLHKYR